MNSFFQNIEVGLHCNKRHALKVIKGDLIDKLLRRTLLSHHLEGINDGIVELLLVQIAASVLVEFQKGLSLKGYLLSPVPQLVILVLRVIALEA